MVVFIFIEVLTYKKTWRSFRHGRSRGLLPIRLRVLLIEDPKVFFIGDPEISFKGYLEVFFIRDLLHTEDLDVFPT